MSRAGVMAAASWSLLFIRGPLLLDPVTTAGTRHWTCPAFQQSRKELEEPGTPHLCPVLPHCQHHPCPCPALLRPAKHLAAGKALSPRRDLGLA